MGVCPGQGPLRPLPLPRTVSAPRAARKVPTWGAEFGGWGAWVMGDGVPCLCLVGAPWSPTPTELSGEVTVPQTVASPCH